MSQQPLVGLGLLIFRGFTITHIRHTTLGRTPLDEWSARRRDLYLTTHNTHKRQTSMPPVGFEPAIPAREQPQTHALDLTYWVDPSARSARSKLTNHIHMAGNYKVKLLTAFKSVTFYIKLAAYWHGDKWAMWREAKTIAHTQRSVLYSFPDVQSD
jgi:hypothetical protein